MPMVTILPEVIGDEPIEICTSIPHEPSQLLIPGRVIYVGMLPVKGYLNNEKNISLIKQNLGEGVLYNDVADVILAFPQKEFDIIVFLIVNSQLWAYWQTLFRTRYKECRYLLPDWMLLPVPNMRPCSLLLGEQVISRLGAWDGISIPLKVYPGHINDLLTRLETYPLCRDRLLKGRPILQINNEYRKTNKSWSVLTMFFSMLLICQMIFVLIALFMPATKEAKHNMKYPEYVVVLSKIANISDAIPIKLSRLNIRGSTIQLTFESDVECKLIINELHNRLPGAKLSMSLSSNSCAVDIDLRGVDD